MRTTNSALSLALVLALSACGGSDTVDTTGATTSSTTATTAATGTPAAAITISGFAFGDPVTAVVGQEVVVSNADGATHTWTSNDGLFDSGNLSSGGTFTFVFDTPGEYAFHCNIHGSMSGTITVTG